MIYPIILAGGSGTRLWPLSRQLYPKQFLPLISKGSMFQDTLERLAPIKHYAPLIICNDEHRFLVAEQLRQLGLNEAQIILEPEGRNTAPAIALAALKIISQNPDAVLLVLAADHLIEDVESFNASIDQAQRLVSQGQLVTFGVVPKHPETGYGYIQRGDAQSSDGYRIKRFVEKPVLATAQAYLETGEYYWNSGMFLFNAQLYLQELERFQPAILKACRAALEGSKQDLYFTRLDAEAFRACPAISVDYAVMEHTGQASVVPLTAGWSDIGSWSSLWEVSRKDNYGNATQGDVIINEGHNLMVHADHRLVATVGVDDLVVVETKDAVLVAHRDHVQDVKKVVEELKINGRTEYLDHREVYRPWGVYDSIDRGQRYQVKRITVKPGAKLSVQMHHHRAEHWVVVSGSAKVMVGDEIYLVTENQSTYIPIGQTHSLENPGVIPLELIEVQSGSYLGEDDIVRFEDSYGRC